MSIDLYDLPVVRLGNDSNPRLVILLWNPGGNPQWPKRLPEYAMRLDGCYAPTGMPLDSLQEYNDWWDDFCAAFREHGVKNSEVLFLEYYPYHTASSRDIPPETTWPNDARDARDENADLLRRCMARNVPVFGYYPAPWLRWVTELHTYTPFQKSNRGWKKQKIKELEIFLSTL